MQMDKHDDITSAIAGSDASHLLRVIGLDEGTATGWALADIASIFRHQMNAPLDFDLSAEALQGATTVAALKQLPAARALGIGNFRELFLHKTPPVAVLKLAKDFFKRMVGLHPKDSAEYQIAYMGYVISVTVARLRHDKRITNLSDANLLKGLDWALGQAWVDASMRKLLNEGRRNFPSVGGR
jgi:hypothetical protein